MLGCHKHDFHLLLAALDHTKSYSMCTDYRRHNCVHGNILCSDISWASSKPTCFFISQRNLVISRFRFQRNRFVWSWVPFLISMDLFPHFSRCNGDQWIDQWLVYPMFRPRLRLPRIRYEGPSKFWSKPATTFLGVRSWGHGPRHAF